MALGGPTKVAGLLGFDKAKGGVQRVQNWMTRGIPPKEKLARPEIFLPEFTVASADAGPDLAPTIASSDATDMDLPPNSLKQV